MDNLSELRPNKKKDKIGEDHGASKILNEEGRLEKLEKKKI